MSHPYLMSQSGNLPSPEQARRIIYEIEKKEAQRIAAEAESPVGKVLRLPPSPSRLEMGKVNRVIQEYNRWAVKEIPGAVLPPHLEYASLESAPKNIRDDMMRRYKEITRNALKNAREREPRPLPALQPPPYARFKKDVVAGEVDHEIAGHIEIGVQGQGRMSIGECGLLLTKSFVQRDVYWNFWEVVGGRTDPRSNPAFDAHARLSIAIEALTVDYLSQVLALLPSYAEASGQTLRRVPTTIPNVDAAVAAVARRGLLTAADTIRSLATAVRQAPELDEAARAPLLDHVTEIAEAVTSPTDHRKASRARAAMLAIANDAASAAQVAEAIQHCESVLGELR